MPLDRVHHFIAAALVLLLCSCSDQQGSTIFPATGRVTMKGQPVVDAVVVFTPVGEHQESMKASQAVTDSEGQFVIRTHITGSQYKEGVAAGEYRVTVTKMEVIADMRRSPKNLLPRKYATLSSSELVAVVQAHGENSFEFELD